MSSGVSSMLRVLFVVGEFPALSETFVLDQVTGLIDRGIEVTVLGRPPAGGSPVHGAVAAYGLLRRTLHYPGTALQRLRALPGTLRELHESRRQPWSTLLGSLRVDRYGRESLTFGPFHRAARAQRAAPFDAIVAHFGPNGVKALELRELGISRAPLVTVFHGHDLSRWPRHHGMRAYRRLFRNGELMLPISEHFRERLLELGCPPEKILVHRVGVDVASFGRALPAMSGAARPRVLSVGRLVEKKGFEHGLRAIARVLGKLPGVHYHVVGDGPLRPALRALARELRLEGHVTFHGMLARDAVGALRSEMDVMLVPSVTASDGDTEGIPVVAMEAMASGLPVIATRHSGIPELVLDDETGLLVPERDPEGIALALRRLCSEPELPQRLIEAARRHVAALHDIHRLNDELAQMLSALARR
jgi:colanic acid/amylovoran biosynthesis glycosyltransferase